MKIVNTEVEQEPIKFEDLEAGQCFKWNRSATTNIWMKTDYDQDAVDLGDGEYCSNLYGEDVFPVNAEVHIVD